MKRISMFLSAMALVAALITGCGGSKDTVASTQAAATTSSGDSPTAVAGPTITIANMAFGQPMTVAPGTQITVANNDSVEHSVTSDTAGLFDVEVEGGEHKTLTAPNQPGDYTYHCKYHPSMKGQLTVK